MGEPTLDRRFHRKLETESLTLTKVLLLVALALGVACAVGVVDQLQRCFHQPLAGEAPLPLFLRTHGLDSPLCLVGPLAFLTVLGVCCISLT